MIRLTEALIVEGKYDKIKLSSIVDAVIIETNGFSVFHDKEKLDLIRRLAASCGIVILTDSDAAGFKIRSFLSGALPKEGVRHAYIPDLYGKERRKSLPSKEGKLGVEGIPKEVLVESLTRADAVFRDMEGPPSRRITKTDLYEDGLSGGEESRALRLRLTKKLNLPSRLSANALLDVLNAMMRYDEYRAELDALKSAGQPANGC